MKERIAWIDNARFIAIWLMIVGHLCGYLLRGDVVSAILYQNFIVAFNMPLFVILSGYGNYVSLVRMSSIRDFITIVWKGFYRVLCPIVLPMLLYCAIEGSWEPFGYEKGFWFLWMLFYLMVFNAVAFGVMKILSSICKRYLHKENESLSLFCSLLIMMVFAILFNRQYTCEMCSYFAVGLLARHYKIFDGTLTKWACIAVVLALSLGAYIYWFDVQSSHWFYWHGLRQMKAEGLLLHYGLRQLIAIGLSFSVILITIKCSKRRTFISELGMHTLTMYIVQDVFVRYSNVFCFNSWGDWLGWFQILGFASGIVLLSMLLVRMYRRLLLGIWK